MKIPFYEKAIGTRPRKNCWVSNIGKVIVGSQDYSGCLWHVDTAYQILDGKNTDPRRDPEEQLMELGWIKVHIPRWAEEEKLQNPPK